MSKFKNIFRRRRKTTVVTNETKIDGELPLFSPYTKIHKPTDMKQNKVQWLVDVFKKKKASVTSSSNKEREVKGVLPFLSQSVVIKTTTSMKESDPEMIADLQSKLQNNACQLFSETIAKAIETVEYTGNAFHLAFNQSESEEDAQAFIAEWNKGNIELLVKYLERWFTPEQATKIAELIKTVHPTVNKMSEIQLYTAQAVLLLKLAKNNFGNVLLAIQDKLKNNPEIILDYMRLVYISVNRVGEDMTWTVSFDCDWEPQHGISWFIKNDEVYGIG